jgi:nitrate reductase gamma subunit
MSTFLFVVLPYVAVILAVGVGLHRYWTNRYGYSSVSSQLLENAKLFWGSVPWHYGITLILLAHLFAWLFPGLTGAVLGHGTRLFVFEASGLGLALFAAAGILVLIARRLASKSRVRVATSPMDWVLLFVLLVQVLTGAVVALFDRWGSHWFLSAAAPWLWSLVSLHPDASTVSALPALIRFHFALGFVVILLFPFTRLVHVFMLPIYYLWRPYQVVVWYRDPRKRLEPIPANAPAPGKSQVTSSTVME